MTPNRRIFLNIVATYGRSLYARVIGLFCGRWTLMAVGEVDHSLVDVCGCLILVVGSSSLTKILLSGMDVPAKAGVTTPATYFLSHNPMARREIW